MKKLVTPAGVFGPFQSIEVLSDRYRADGADLPFVVVGDGDILDVEPGDFPAPPKTRDQLKAERQAAVDAIRVTTASGKTFDGDETSQTRMARAIVGMQAAGAPTITWVLADNTPTEVTVAELTEALILAGQAQAEVWVIE